MKVTLMICLNQSILKYDKHPEIVRERFRLDYWFIQSFRNNYIKLPKELNLQEKAWLTFKILMIMNALNGV